MSRSLIRLLLMVALLADACGPVASSVPTDGTTPAVAVTPLPATTPTVAALPSLPVNAPIVTTPAPTAIAATPTPLSVAVRERPTPIAAPSCLSSATAPIAGGETVTDIAAASGEHLVISTYTPSISRTNIFVSDDAGQTWTSARTLNDYINNLIPSPAYARDHLVFAAGSGGVYRSFNGGISWASITPATWFTNTPTVRQFGISPDFANDRTIMFAGHFAPRGVFASTDGGATWIDWLVDSVDALLFSPNYAIDRAVWVARNDERTFRRDVLVTTNQGDQWDFVRSGTALPLAISPAYAQDSTIIWTDVSGGLYLSRNSDRVFPLIEKANADTLHIWQNIPGTGWVVTGEQYVRDLGFSTDFATDRTAFAVTDQSVIVSRDGGVSWRPLCYAALDAPAPGPARYARLSISPDFSTDKTIYIGGAGASLLISHDAGQSWASVSLR